MVIKQITTTHIMLFNNDEIDLKSLQRPESLAHLSKKYNLNLIPMPEVLGLPMPLQYVFRGGEFSVNNRSYIIFEITFDTRKIVIKIQAPSDISELFFHEFRKDLQAIDVRKEKPEFVPIITTYETQTIAKMSGSLENLIRGSKLHDFFSTTNDSLPKHGAQNFYLPTSFKFKMSFFNLPENLIKNRITLSDKHVLIEYREQTNPDDNILFIVTPAEYEIHHEILSQLDKMLKD